MKIKVGILTFFRTINYGAYLQAYALSHRLNQEDDLEAEIINYRMPAEDHYYNQWVRPGKNVLKFIYSLKRQNTFRKALPLLPLSSQECCSNKTEDFISYVQGKYDVIIAGSDEIWRIGGIRGFPTPYFLPGDLRCKKISYAACGMTPLSTRPEKEVKQMKKYLDDFDYIGVRDTATFEETEHIVSRPDKIHINFDPVFIYDFHPDPARGRQLIRKYFHISGVKRIIVMMYSESTSKQSFDRFFKDRYQKDFEVISIYQWSHFFKNSPLVSPLDLIHIIAAADGVISMFYHGICAAVITGTPFFAIERRSPDQRQSKLYDLLSRLGLLDFYLLGVGDFIESVNLEPFLNKVRNGEREDLSLAVKEAGDEFEDFLQVVRSDDPEKKDSSSEAQEEVR